MNIKGMKNILREVDKELMVLLYDTDDKELFRKPLEKLMEDTAFDKYHCEQMACVLNYDSDAGYKNPEELKKQFLISIGVNNKVDTSDRLTIGDFEDGFWDCGGIAYSNLMHKNLVYDIEHFDDCDKEAQKEIRRMMKKYNKFPLDYIELYFDEYDVFDMYEDDPEAVYDEIDFGNILSVNVFPLLPEGMLLFGQNFSRISFIFLM